MTMNGQVRMNRRAGFKPNWLKIARRPRNGPKAKTFNAAEKFCIMRAAACGVSILSTIVLRIEESVEMTLELV